MRNASDQVLFKFNHAMPLIPDTLHYSTGFKSPLIDRPLYWFRRSSAVPALRLALAAAGPKAAGNRLVAN
jgi:hypothetical protein